MIFDEAGTYQIEYTATDECGNTTNVERTVIVEAPPRTVLYTDGTFIINELSRDIDANIAEHGQPTNIYAPFNPNGATDVDKYIFSSDSQRPWDSQKTSILSVEIGSNIAPYSFANWFSGCQALTTLDVSNLNTSEATNMQKMFYNCRALTTLDLSNFDTSKVTNMDSMFQDCITLTSLDLSSFDTSRVTNMVNMFGGCQALTTLDVSSFDTSEVTNMNGMFVGCEALTTLDLSGFDTSEVTNMQYMFRLCRSMKTIYTSSNFIVSQVTNSSDMFRIMSTNLVGGAGTVWSSSNPYDKTYAHIDDGVSDPGYFTAKS